MQNFHFKLQPLLNKERIYENECVGKLATIQEKFVDENDKLETLRKRKVTCQGDLELKKQHYIAPDELRAYEEYFMTLGSNINAGNLRLKELADELRTVQEELGKRVKKRKALEKLRDRWEEEYKSYLVSMSNIEMDDIAMTKFINELVAKND